MTACLALNTEELLRDEITAVVCAEDSISFGDMVQKLRERLTNSDSIPSWYGVAARIKKILAAEPGAKDGLSSEAKVALDHMLGSGELNVNSATGRICPGLKPYCCSYAG